MAVPAGLEELASPPEAGRRARARHSIERYVGLIGRVGGRPQRRLVFLPGASDALEK